MQNMLFALSLFVSLLTYINSSSIQVQLSYGQWKKKFKGVQVMSQGEESYRRQIFNKKSRQVAKWNSKKNKSFKKTVNNIFADLTEEEFEAIYLMPVIEVEPPVTDLQALIEDDDEIQGNGRLLYKTVEHTVTPVKNQRSCGSCWAFSTIAAVEAEWLRVNGQVLDLSEQQLVSCDSSNGGCDGGWPYKAGEYLQKNNARGENKYPYTAEDDSCDNSALSTKKYVVRRAKITAKRDGESDYGKAIQRALRKRPVSIVLSASGWSSYDSGVFDQCRTSVNHAVLAMGYNKPQNTWKIKNSWGTGFGENGYIRINPCDCNSCKYYGNFNKVKVLN